VRGRALLALAAALLPAPALACRLALVLALDTSSSVDPAEDRLQRQGLAAALLAPEVRAALFAVPAPVALHAFEWSGAEEQVTLLDWTLIETEADLAAAAATLGGSVRGRSDLPTALGSALGHAAVTLRQGPDCLLRKIDVSGDGPNNHRFPPASAYAAFDFSDITVNGLVILGAGSEIDVVDYYAREVLHGPGAFLETADGYDDFARAMRRKLERELRPAVVGAAPGARPAPG